MWHSVTHTCLKMHLPTGRKTDEDDDNELTGVDT